ncbi:MAG: 50S ribosomal protein L29 [Candidatus Pacebacteria bacterium]|nr:50S ribosomal protein L29 [Candidatus Paceibacterota bacterium]MCF7857421.1 50S ribosomal protein L29 [Candidatus Paceibacterota bacterium]
MSELQQKNDGDLLKFIEEKREELRKIRFGTAGSGMRNSHAIRDIRREVAQALTELTKRTKVGA